MKYIHKKNFITTLFQIRCCYIDLNFFTIGNWNLHIVNRIRKIKEVKFSSIITLKYY